MDRKWLSFLREQYPAGTRIKLREMKDPYSPVEPGTTGTLQGIDDAGNFLMKWDNGRTLSLEIGEDSFSILPPEMHLLKLYMPITVDCYERNRWGDYDSEPTQLDNHTALGFVDNISAAIAKNHLPDEGAQGLMQYYDDNERVRQKVQSLFFRVEARDNRLWGVAECQVIGELTANELQALKDYAGGQASDGFGEGFEQREIKVGDCQLYAHLWQDDNWSIQTEQECFAQDAPQMGGITFA